MTKYFALILCIVALAGCSLTGKPSGPIINSGSTKSGAITTSQISTGVDLLSGEDLTISGSVTAITGKLSGNIQDGVAFIKDYNVWVKSGSQLIQLTKNGGRTDLCNNGQPLEYLDPQIHDEFLVMIVKCKGESSAAYIRNIELGWSYKLTDTNSVKFNKHSDEQYGITYPWGTQGYTKQRIQQKYSSFKKNTKKEVISKKDPQGNILFQELPYGDVEELGSFISNEPPVYKKYEDGNLFFKQSITKNDQIQKLPLNDKLSLYIRQDNIGDCDGQNNIECIDYTVNIGYELDNEQMYTKGVIGKLQTVGGLGSKNIGYIYKKLDIYSINLPQIESYSFEKPSQIFFNSITKEITTDTDTYKQIEILEKQRQTREQNSVLCKISIDPRDKGDFKVMAFRAKGVCPDKSVDKAFFERITYHRNPTINKFNFIGID